MSSDTTARDAYDAWHQNIGEDAPHADYPWHQLIRRHLRDADLAGKRVLEIGCGRGGFTCWLASQAARPTEVVGADFSPAAVEIARTWSAGQFNNVSWAVADIQDIPFPDASFHTVFSCETIEHVPDPALALRQLARVLAPGGRLYLTTPNYVGTIGLYRLYGSLLGRTFTEGGQPINNWTSIGKTKSWVRHAGLRIVAVASCGHYLLVPRRPPIRLGWFDRLGPLTRWCGHHSLVVAEKP